jgi:lipopolysaccharide transport protein LptA
MRHCFVLGLILVGLSNSFLAQVLENSEGTKKMRRQATEAISKETEFNTMITSDRFELALEKGEGVFIGNVRISHPQYTILAEAADIRFEPNRPDLIRRFVARGNVHWKAVDKEGTCDVLDYEPLKGRITLSANAIAKEKQRTLYGDLFIWDQKKNRLFSIGRSRVEFHE